MKKLVTTLIIVLPLVLIIALFAVTGIARISADIPATGIVINNKGEDGVLFFEITDCITFFESDLGVEVLPKVASNRDYTLKITDITGERESTIVTREADGSFSLNGVGIAKLTYTSRDGGYSDSVLFNITSRGVLEYSPFVLDDDGKVYELEKGFDTDFQITLKSGNYTLGGAYTPDTLMSVQSHFESSNDKILHFIDTNGHFNACFSGNSTITVTVDGAKGPIVKTIAVTVEPSGTVTIDGQNLVGNTPRLSAPLGAKSITFGVQSSDIHSPNNISVDGANISATTVKRIDELADAYLVTVNFEHTFDYEIPISYSLNINGTPYNFYIEFKNRSFGIYAPSNPSGQGDIALIAGTTVQLSAACTPQSPNIAYEWSLDDQAAVRILSAENNACVLQVEGEGLAALTLIWTEFDEDGNVIASGSETRTLTGVQGYSSILFAENAENYGLGELAIASHTYDKDGKKILNAYESKFRAYGRDVRGGATTNLSDIEFSVNDPSIASVYVVDGKVVVYAHGNGDVTVTATWKYGTLFGISPASMTFKAIDGIAADSHDDLTLAFKDNLPVVLTDDVYLGENLFDYSPDGSRRPKYPQDVMREKLMSYTSELPTTADWQYYKNLGMAHPSVRYCLEISQNVYGNGHFINAQYITDMLDGTDTPYDFAVFNGPLNFVATSPDGINLVSVKGQDNIVFLIRKDGVTVDNTVLKGCDDQALYEDGAINLSLLNNMGTTLEIMANATLTRSRVMNGRTVVRIYGRDGIDEASAVNAQKERINAVIDNCILQNAREFILKISTNRFVRGTIQNSSPYLLDKDGNPYLNCNSSACDSYLNDGYFMSNYVLTDVVLKDSMLRTSGMFAIGLESHFSGILLTGSKNSLFQIDGWTDLAATSYPAALHLVGNVVLADWKNVMSMDSSTLIESNTTDEALAFLSLNIAEMLKTVQQVGGDKFKNIIDNKNGDDMVHGGIAFYGGGKNYSVLDTSQYTFEAMNSYNVNLSILARSSDKNIVNQGLMLPLAAGTGDFRFVIFDSQSKFDFNAQNKLLYPLE